MLIMTKYYELFTSAAAARALEIDDVPPVRFIGQGNIMQEIRKYSVVNDMSMAYSKNK